MLRPPRLIERAARLLRRGRCRLEDAEVEQVLREARPQPRPLEPEAAQRILAAALAASRRRRARTLYFGAAVGGLGALALGFNLETAAPRGGEALPEPPRHAEAQRLPVPPGADTEAAPQRPPVREARPARLASAPTARPPARRPHTPSPLPAVAESPDGVEAPVTEETPVVLAFDPEALSLAWKDEPPSYSVVIEEPGLGVVSAFAGGLVEDGDGGWAWYEQAAQPDLGVQRLLVTYDEETQTMGYAIVHEEQEEREERSDVDDSQGRNEVAAEVEGSGD